ncbi:hypothetical protein FACS1894184_16790 [Clostridia bacterium]|nr:hypothetical protein FACS1894184_16790 [Clostridia bacterium]
MLTVDRIEGKYAVCEDQDRVMHDIPLSELPEGVREGSRLELVDDKYELMVPVESGIRVRFDRLRRKRV